MEFLGGILFAAFVLFLGVKVKKIKIEFGDFKEDNSSSGAGGGTRPGTKVK